MSVYLTLEWLVPREHVRETELALTAVREHVGAAHPKIRAVRVIRETGDDGAEPAPIRFRWEERYDSPEDAQDLDLGEACDDVWLNVWLLAVPGSHGQSIWDDDGRPDWLAD